MSVPGHSIHRRSAPQQAGQSEAGKHRKGIFQPRRGPDRQRKREGTTMVDPQVLTKVKTVERDEVAGVAGEEEVVGIKTRSGKRSFPAAKVGDSGGVRCGGGGIVDDARKRKKKVYDAGTPPPLVNPSQKNNLPRLSLSSPPCPHPQGECPDPPLDHLGTCRIHGMTFCDPACQDFVIYPRRKLGSGDSRSEPVVVSLSVKTASPSYPIIAHLLAFPPPAPVYSRAAMRSGCHAGPWFGPCGLTCHPPEHWSAHAKVPSLCPTSTSISQPHLFS